MSVQSSRLSFVSLLAQFFLVSALDNKCEDLLKGKYLISRLWTLSDGGTVNTTTGVVDSFQTGFAPEVQTFTGFNQYVGSAGDATSPSQNYFFNIFDLKTQGDAAQTSAVVYKAQSDLYDSIEEQTFGEGIIDFYTATSCDFTNNFSGKYISSRMWTSTTAGTSSQDIVNVFRTGFRGTVETMSGFQLYLGVKMDQNRALFINIFDDDVGAATANTAAIDFFENSELSGKATVEMYSGLIGFDYSNLPNKCTNVEKGLFMVGRLWSMAVTAGSIDTTAGVVTEFKKGFAPKVQTMEGFVQYVGSHGASDHPTLCYFYNLFKTEAEASRAQQAAINFKEDGQLHNSIVEHTFYEGEINFYEALTCGDSVDFSGKFIASRVWKSTSDNLSGQDIVNSFRDGFRRTIKKQDGFQLYIGTVVDAKTAAFVNVFDTEEGAANANTLASNFVASTTWAEDATLTAYSGPLDFDFRGQKEASLASSTTVSLTFLLLIACSLLLIQ